MSLILDVVVVVLLGLTIVFAARLSLQLRRLRDSRSDLDRVVRDLVKNLDRADRAISGLKEAARESGTDLQDAIDKAVSLSDELQLITDSGDRLASRLEALVDSGRPLVNAATADNASAPRSPAAQPAPRSPAAQASPIKPVSAPVSAGNDASYAQHLRKLDHAAVEDRAPKTSFAIRDPDAERGIDPTADRMALSEDGSGQGLYSEAERDLFRAMKERAGKPDTHKPDTNKFGAKA